jgi:hypothetical protein
VIPFDKFNPSVGKPVGIPVAGELMASRWAFEAYMVTQFKDNPFEEQFYEFDKTISQSDYKRVYYIPTLETKLAYCLNHRASWRNSRDEKMTASLNLLQNEIRYELVKVGANRLPEIEDLAIGRFDSAVYDSTASFLKTLKRFYGIKASKAAEEKETKIRSLTGTPEATELFTARRNQYVNKAVSDAVNNTTSGKMIVEYEGRLIQKIFPVYMDEHRPLHFFDFSANLYQPTKHFASIHIDTLYFNIAVIWSMTVFLFITLYFDLLKKFIEVLEGNRKYRRKDRH